MKKLLVIALVLFSLGCKKDTLTLNNPSDVSDVRAEAVIGGAIVRWKLPTDSNFLYLEVSYKKNDKVIVTKVSKYTDSLLVEGLLNKLDYTFDVQAFNANHDGEVAGGLLTTNSVKPIIRPVETKYFPNDLTKIEGITVDMVETYTQESSEGPKGNLFDGNINSYWHSSWSANVAPLPHWIIVNFPEETTIGAMKYYFRQNNNDEGGRPSQFALETSEDGTTWKREWTSKDGLAVTPANAEKSLDFDKNFTSKHFRLLILKNPGNKTYTHLGELAFYTMRSELTDMEKLAEENY